MDTFTEKINTKYLEDEIEKMEKTARGLEQMINEKDPERAADLIETLNDMYSATIDAIENKKSKFQQLYDKSVSCEDN